MFNPSLSPLPSTVPPLHPSLLYSPHLYPHVHSVPYLHPSSILLISIPPTSSPSTITTIHFTTYLHPCLTLANQWLQCKHSLTRWKSLNPSHHRDDNSISTFPPPLPLPTFTPHIAIPTFTSRRSLYAYNLLPPPTATLLPPLHTPHSIEVW